MLFEVISDLDPNSMKMLQNMYNKYSLKVFKTSEFFNQDVKSVTSDDIQDFEFFTAKKLLNNELLIAMSAGGRFPGPGNYIEDDLKISNLGETIIKLLNN